MTIAISPFDSALTMAQAIKDGRVTSRQLVDMCIARIERYDGSINAVVQRDFEGARQRADQADEKVQQWKNNNRKEDVDGLISLGVFHGVPMTVKEGNATPGFSMSFGDPLVAGWLPSWLSSETTRPMLEEGGAILVGKTNLPIHQCDWECNNPVYGRTNNPYHLGRSPGGSSGGAAAALAAGFTPLEIGSDIGGSIRIPSAFCGVVGHCATRGVVPSLDVQLGCGCIDKVLSKLMHDIVWIARAGPMARNVEDVAAMLEIMGGEMAEALQRPKESVTLADYRIGIWRTHKTSPPGQEVSSAMDKAVAALKAAGATVQEIEPPVDPMHTYKLYLRYLSPFVKFHMPKEQKENAKNGRPQDSYPPDILSPFVEMDLVSVHGIPGTTDASFEAADIAWDSYLKTFDAVLCPIFPCEAYRNESQPEDMLADCKYLARKLLVDGKERYYGDQLFWPHLSVLLGLPATAFPVCFTTGSSGDSRLPVGIQAVGARGNDFIVLDVVKKLMKELGTNEFQPPAKFP